MLPPPPAGFSLLLVGFFVEESADDDPSLLAGRTTSCTPTSIGLLVSSLYSAVVHGRHSAWQAESLAHHCFRSPCVFKDLILWTMDHLLRCPRMAWGESVDIGYWNWRCDANGSEPNTTLHCDPHDGSLYLAHCSAHEWPRGPLLPSPAYSDHSGSHIAQTMTACSI